MTATGRELIQSEPWTDGPGKALGGGKTRMVGAEQKVAAGRIRPACNELGAFVNGVQDLAAGGELTTAQATLLIDQAGLIRSVIPCT
jgi:hypothetical protein